MALYAMEPWKALGVYPALGADGGQQALPQVAAVYEGPRDSV